MFNKEPLIHLIILKRMSSSSSSFLRRINAVSYTHLDVYKRQGLEELRSKLLTRPPPTTGRPPGQGTYHWRQAIISGLHTRGFGWPITINVQLEPTKFEFSGTIVADVWSTVTTYGLPVHAAYVKSVDSVNFQVIHK